MIRPIESDEVEEIVRAFPGPIVLFPSRGQSWTSVIVAVGLTIASLTVTLSALSSWRDGVEVAETKVITGTLVTALFGLCTAISVIGLLPGSNWLRLDANGFEVTSLFRSRVYGWSDVGDFSVWNRRGGSYVMFRAASRYPTARDRWSQIWRIKQQLPGTYGFAAEDLLQLFTAWQNLALRSRGRDLGERPSPEMPGGASRPLGARDRPDLFRASFGLCSISARWLWKELRSCASVLVWV
jgi:hypothetical protein